jgi:hypothetical protein
MPTPFESASLNLQLFDLRREPVLREARAWFVNEFNPESLADFAAAAGGPRHASLRMVLGYWEMAASMVTTGAIDGDAFRAAHTEIVVTFAKVHPLLAEIRAMGQPDFCAHMENVVLAAPGAEATLAKITAALRAAAEARRAAAAPA